MTIPPKARYVQRAKATCCRDLRRRNFDSIEVTYDTNRKSVESRSRRAVLSAAPRNSPGRRADAHLMRGLSARTLREMEQLATLEYAVARGQLTPSAALTEARALRLPERQLDVFKPATAPPQRQVPRPPRPAVHPITEARAHALCADFSAKLGFPVRLDWRSDSTRLEIDPKHATELRIPGGVVRHTGVTEDALGLMVAHEIGHRTLETRDEARADYWAARYGIRKLWPSDDTTAFANRAIDAALATLEFCGHGSDQSFDPASATDTITIPLGGYPSLQDRLTLYQAGIAARPMPKVRRERWR